MSSLPNYSEFMASTPGVEVKYSCNIIRTVIGNPGWIERRKRALLRDLPPEGASLNEEGYERACDLRSEIAVLEALSQGHHVKVTKD